MAQLISLIQALIIVLEVFFIARFVAQILDMQMKNPITRLLVDVTEPLLAPVRRFMPTTGGIDFSPTVVLVLLFILQRVLASAG
ncbi:MAG TPA: YggT family protein [Thermomicrobiales bacterium]|nr:YggT family protein [Thermomicrobiales bacterium]